MSTFIRLILAVLLDVSILAISNDEWILLQTLEAVRALRLPPCPIECYFPVVSASQALQQITSPTSIVTGCVGPVDRQELQEAIAESSTNVLVIDLQGKEVLADAELLVALRTSPVFCATNSSLEGALAPLSFAMDPKAGGLNPSLYDNLCRACAGPDPSFSMIKDAYGHIMHELLSACIWWTSTPNTIRFAEKADRSIAPSALEASFAATQAFIQWRSFARSYARPLCVSRIVLVRPRF